MNIRNNKGITLLSLVITVIILSIITYVVVSISVGMSGVAKFQNIETYMMLIKSKCDRMSEDVVIGEMTENNLYGVKQTSGTFAGWYKLRQNELNDLGLEKAKEADGYYVKYGIEDGSEVDVAYERGIQNEGVMYYRLSDIPITEK